MIAGIVVLPFSFASCPVGAEIEDNTPSLRSIWEDYFSMGNIVAFQHHRRPPDIGNPTRWNLLRRHFHILTAEDEMKPDHLQPARGNFTWSRANRIVSETLGSGMRVHGHTLAWHSQSPYWMNQVSSGGGPISRNVAIQNLRTHIDRVMRQFPGVESWDVLNEVFAGGGGSAVSGGNWRANLRNYTPGGPPHGTGTPWARAIGVYPHDVQNPNTHCYIWIAFTTARSVADAMGRPDMILYYNDYNEENPNKRAAIYYMVREMNTRFAAQNNGRLLIDAIGMQAHYHAEGQGSGAAYPWGRTNLVYVRESMERFLRLIDDGLLRYISITELDITVGNGPITPGQARQQAIMYAQLFRIFREFARENPGRLRRVSIWGINDDASWRHRGNPLLWNSRLEPKEAFWAVAHPDGFLNPDGSPRPAAQINAFLYNPMTYIDARHW